MEPQTTKTKSPAGSPRAAAAQAGPSVQPITHTQTDFAPLAIGGAGTQVEAEDVDSSDTDSLLTTECSTETTSVSSSVFEFTYANGRRYHSDRFRSADYFMPNDENEQERLDLYHHQFLQFLGGKLHLAPLDNPQRVLDVGTGTGIWAIDFADEYEGAEVIGTDISPVQSQWVPPNCKFEIDDMEEEWTYQDDLFDYIHMRSLSGAFHDWAKVLKNAYNKTKPGGYLEFQDYGCECFLANGKALDYPDSNHPLSVWLHEIVQASNKVGRPLVMGKLMKRLMEEAGFVDVVENTTIWPIGNWPKDKRLKEVGRWGLIGITDSLYPFALSLLTKSGWSVKQVEDLCDSVRKGLPKQKYYFHGWFVYGRKPEDKKHTH